MRTHTPFASKRINMSSDDGRGEGTERIFPNDLLPRILMHGNGPISILRSTLRSRRARPLPGFCPYDDCSGPAREVPLPVCQWLYVPAPGTAGPFPRRRNPRLGLGAAAGLGVGFDPTNNVPAGDRDTRNDLSASIALESSAPPPRNRNPGDSR